MLYTAFIVELAMAVQGHEGWHQGSVSWTHNNPGNIRNHGQFVYFPTYALGFAALEGDLYAKITNHSSSMTSYYKKNNRYYANATFQDIYNVYAPKEDGNDPVAYCDAMCHALQKYGLAPQTPLYLVSKLADGSTTTLAANIPVPQPTVENPNEVVRYLKRLIQNTTIAIVKTRLSQRLQAYIATHTL